MAKKQHFTRDDMWFAGEDKQLRFTILDENAVAVDITGWAVRFAFGEMPGDDAIFEKTVGSGITLTTPLSGLLTVQVQDADTDALAAGSYVYSLKRMDNNTETILAFGDVLLQRAAGDPVV